MMVNADRALQQNCEATDRSSRSESSHMIDVHNEIQQARKSGWQLKGCIRQSSLRFEAAWTTRNQGIAVLFTGLSQVIHVDRSDAVHRHNHKHAIAFGQPKNSPLTSSSHGLPVSQTVCISVRARPT